jgi:hypothetical protein
LANTLNLGLNHFRIVMKSVAPSQADTTLVHRLSKHSLNPAALRAGNHLVYSTFGRPLQKKTLKTFCRGAGTKFVVDGQALFWSYLVAVFSPPATVARSSLR